MVRGSILLFKALDHDIVIMIGYH